MLCQELWIDIGSGILAACWPTMVNLIAGPSTIWIWDTGYVCGIVCDICLWYFPCPSMASFHASNQDVMHPPPGRYARGGASSGQGHWQVRKCGGARCDPQPGWSWDDLWGDLSDHAKQFSTLLLLLMVYLLSYRIAKIYIQLLYFAQKVGHYRLSLHLRPTHRCHLCPVFCLPEACNFTAASIENETDQWPFVAICLAFHVPKKALSLPVSSLCTIFLTRASPVLKNMGENKSPHVMPS